MAEPIQPVGRDGDKNKDAAADNSTQQSSEKFLHDLRGDGFAASLNFKNCIKGCHDQSSNNEFSDRPFLSLKSIMDPDSNLKPELREAKQLELFQKQGQLDKTTHLLSRLPKDLTLTRQADKFTLATDFSKLPETMPGLRASDTVKSVLSALKTISFNSGELIAEFKPGQQIDIKKDAPIVGHIESLKLGDEHGELRYTIVESKDSPGEFAMRKISGLSLKRAEGSDLRFHSLALKGAGNKASLLVEMDNPAMRPASIPEYLWPDTVTVPVPLDKLIPAPPPPQNITESEFTALAERIKDLQSFDFSKHLEEKTKRNSDQALQVLFQEIAKLKEQRDSGSFAAELPESDLVKGIKEVVSQVTGLQKNGQNFEITRSGDAKKIELGESAVLIEPILKFTLGDDPRVSQISDISGISITTPLPEELNWGKELNTNLKEVSLSAPQSDGSRELRVGMDKLVRSIRVKVDEQFQPVKDTDGNWKVQLLIENPLATSSDNQLPISLRIGKDGKLNMKNSELLDIVGDSTGQASDLSVAGSGNFIWSVGSKTASGFLDFFGW